jgi:hypothetical protein
VKITPPTQVVPYATSASASGVSVSDPGGFYPPGATLEEILAAIGAGTSPNAFLTKIGGEVHTLQALDPMGATATVDLANANWFYGELLEDCTISTTGWTANKGCYIQVELAGGAGGFLATFSGVTWVGSAPVAIDAGEVIHVVLYSRDGGTTIWGGLAAEASDGMVPYYIPPGHVFTIPLYKQGLFSAPIVVDGVLDVVGYLIEVGGGSFTPASDPGDIADPTIATAEVVGLKLNALMADMRTAGML